MKLKRDGKIYEFVEHVIMNYELGPYTWLLFVAGCGITFGLGWMAADWVISAR